jgi:hypothetical protein
MPSLTDQAPARFIELLQSYGPVASSDSLCDENVRQTKEAFGVEPIATPAVRLSDIGKNILELGRNVILTGTAGDGKTYHIRQFLEEAFPQEATNWPGESGILAFALPDGRQLRIIRDLSEMSDRDKAQELDALCAALLGEAADYLYLVAANDGQLLKYFRDAASGDVTGRAEKLHRRIATMLRNEDETVPDLSLALINLSRTWSSETVERIFDAVLNHPAWATACAGCPAEEGENPCPIKLNRALLLGREDEGRFRKRLVQSLRLAAANDQHVPIRQLLTLAVNVVLGDQKNPDRPLLDCAQARKRAARRDYSLTDPYSNAAGLNLRADRKRANRVFQIFEMFGLGYETNNAIDSALVKQRPRQLHERLFGEEKTYGSDLFDPLRRAYLGGGGGEAAVRAFRKGLEAQRRRAFFRLPDNPERETDSPWRLTIFHHGGEYLDLLDALAEGGPRDRIDRFTRILVRGLNRAFTGMMASDEDNLWLAGTIGRTDDAAGRVSTVEPVGRSTTSMLSLRLFRHEVSKRPALEVAPHSKFGFEGALPWLDLRPLLFEYLVRVANGSLPASFSRQCHQEIRHFGLVTVTEVRKLFPPGENEPDRIRVLSLGDQGEIQQSPVEV